LIRDALRFQPTEATYWLSRRVAKLHRGKGVVEGNVFLFDPFDYAAAGKCTLAPCDDEHLHLTTVWDGTHAGDHPANGMFSVQWEGIDFTLYWITPGENTGSYFALVASQRADALRFYETVSRWAQEPTGAILVFHAGQWLKDEGLFESIRDASLDNLVLPPGQKDEIAADAPRFFASRERYARYKIPWKRGVLFVGPPGNGKTHAVKAIVNTSTVPCVYVRSFDLPGHPFPGAGIAMVFERARKIAPCILVLEDLDALVRDDNRAYFLNELDGFDRNDGMLVLATTNHPERIDAAIVDRPSRFDRKYAFGLPGPDERRAYVVQWNAGLDAELRLDDDEIANVAGSTDGFSYAYLKELFVSSLMRWVGDESARFGALMAGQVGMLRDQIATEPEQEPGGQGIPDNFGWAMAGMPGSYHTVMRAMMRRNR
jgi:hypothetical protein